VNLTVESKNYVLVNHEQPAMTLRCGLQRSRYGNETLLLAIKTYSNATSCLTVNARQVHASVFWNARCLDSAGRQDGPKGWSVPR
jgi:hypothetical protein